MNKFITRTLCLANLAFFVYGMCTGNYVMAAVNGIIGFALTTFWND